MEDKKDSEEVVIDFSAVRRKLKGFFSKGNKQEEEPAPHTHQAHSTHHTASPHHQPHEHKEHHPISEDHSKSSADEITFDWKQVTAFGKTHAKWLIPLLCILIAMSFSIYFRTMPQRLPITDSWAQGTVYNFYQNQLQQQINQQLRQRNAALDAEVRDLKNGTEAIEERARSSLGMVKRDEVFFQIVGKISPLATSSVTPTNRQE